VIGQVREATVVAKGSGVRVRVKVPGDALDDYQWRRDPDIARYDAARPLTASFTEFLRQYEIDLGVVDRRRRLYALEDDHGTHIGNIMYYNADESFQTAEFGIVLGPGVYRGRGLGREAAIAFLHYLFVVERFNYIYLHTLEWNERARRCFEHAGFTVAARVRRRQEWFLRMEANRGPWLEWYASGRCSRSPDGLDHGH
jgi:RimJ/RimL family protein N-acetyltransferase